MISLVLGGARSGKSAVAESIVSGLDAPVTYVATLEVGDDAESGGARSSGTGHSAPRRGARLRPGATSPE